MYHSGDPRASLANGSVDATASLSTAGDLAFDGPQYGRFDKDLPDEKTTCGDTWMCRGQNFLVAYSKAQDGCVLSRTEDDQPDEYALLLPRPDTLAEVTWHGDTEIIPGHSISFVPAGASEVKIRGCGEVVRIFTARAADLAARCSNAQSYARPHLNVAPLASWA